jgi:hypothetical protein
MLHMWKKVGPFWKVVKFMMPFVKTMCVGLHYWTYGGPQGENMVKWTKGTKVKVIFQGLHMTCVIFVGL